MFVNVFLRRFLPFLLAAVLGAACYDLLTQPAAVPPALAVPPVIDEFHGRGSGYGSQSGWGHDSGTAYKPAATGFTTKLLIISKPRATYTEAARTNGVEGSVRLKVTLLASGQVGSITAITELPDGLTEQAIAAARQIRFEPKKVNGVPISVIQTVEYTFSLY